MTFNLMRSLKYIAKKCNMALCPRTPKVPPELSAGVDYFFNSKIKTKAGRHHSVYIALSNPQKIRP